jgi:hypothetical protein
MNKEGKAELFSRRMALFAAIAAVSAVAVPTAALITSDDAEATVGTARRGARRTGRRVTRRAVRR